jgi:hypothetical protein
MADENVVAPEVKPVEPAPEVKPGETLVTDNKPPEEIKYELKLPDGSELDAAHVEKIVSFSKEQGFSPEHAQKILDREAAILSETKKSTLESFQKQQAEVIEKSSKSWVETAYSDKEIGGEHFNKNTEMARRYINHYGSPSLKKALDDSRLGNHPELLRMIVRAAKDMGEDSFIHASARPEAGPLSLEERMYGSSHVESE